MSDNPLYRVHPKATAQVKMLIHLDISKSQFYGEHKDEFKFLYQLTNLNRLNLSQCFEEAKCSTLAPFPPLVDLYHLELAGVGLLSVVGIEEKFPKVRILDLRGNKIYSTDTLEQLKPMRKLTNLYLEKNPICMHLHLKDMVAQSLPKVETLDQEQIREVGSKYREKILECKR